MKHQSITISNRAGKEVTAQDPVIISASRATDIPAFYAEWFFRRLDEGYVVWRNPYNGLPSYVSFQNCRFVVFWSKNPRPLLPLLPRLKERGIGCYIQYTLNDYEGDGLEPNLPPLAQRIDTFKQLVEQLGSGSVVWRFDPLVLTDKIGIEELLTKISGIADELKGYAEKLVFSFADIGSYRKVGRNLESAGIHYREWDEASMREFARRLDELNRERWNFRLATCSEAIPLEEYGIEHNRCIDPDLIARLSNDTEHLRLLNKAGHDGGQRKLCGCILSKDIGNYNTCPHGCAYCYANTSPSSATTNYHRHLQNPNLETII